MEETVLKEARILIVDDNVSNIDILSDLLELAGYSNLQSTTDSRVVVDIVHSFHPDLILLDLMMPHFDGFEVMDQLKEVIPVDSYLPILVLTADITIEARHRALRGGAKDFLSKPFNMLEIQARIKNLLETRYLHLLLKDQNLILEEKVRERTYELEKAYHKIKLANRELSMLDQAKDGFLNLISHELRTPLNGILGFTGILKDVVNSPEVLEYINCIDMSAKRLEKFAYQALLITELRVRNLNVKPEKLQIKELFTNSTLLLQEKTKKKSITVRLQNNSGTDLLIGDRELIQICFDRLLDNSVKYSPDESVVILNVYTKDNSVVCDFIDLGAGFNQDILENPFSPFSNYQEHVDENTGLNLLLIKYIMDAHNGQIEINNNESKGAIVSLTFVDQNQVLKA